MARGCKKCGRKGHYAKTCKAPTRQPSWVDAEPGSILPPRTQQSPLQPQTPAPISAQEAAYVTATSTVRDREAFPDHPAPRRPEASDGSAQVFEHFTPANIGDPQRAQHWETAHALMGLDPAPPQGQSPFWGPPLEEWPQVADALRSTEWTLYKEALRECVSRARPWDHFNSGAIQECTNEQQLSDLVQTILRGRSTIPPGSFERCPVMPSKILAVLVIAEKPHPRALLAPRAAELVTVAFKATMEAVRDSAWRNEYVALYLLFFWLLFPRQRKGSLLSLGKKQARRAASLLSGGAAALLLQLMDSVERTQQKRNRWDQQPRAALSEHELEQLRATQVWRLREYGRLAEAYRSASQPDVVHPRKDLEPRDEALINAKLPARPSNCPTPAKAKDLMDQEGVPVWEITKEMLARIMANGSGTVHIGTRGKALGCTGLPREVLRVMSATAAFESTLEQWAQTLQSIVNMRAPPHVIDLIQTHRALIINQHGKDRVVGIPGMDHLAIATMWNNEFHLRTSDSQMFKGKIPAPGGGIPLASQLAIQTKGGAQLLVEDLQECIDTIQSEEKRDWLLVQMDVKNQHHTFSHEALKIQLQCLGPQASHLQRTTQMMAAGYTFQFANGHQRLGTGSPIGDTDASTKAAVVLQPLLDESAEIHHQHMLHLTAFADNTVALISRARFSLFVQGMKDKGAPVGINFPDTGCSVVCLAEDAQLTAKELSDAGCSGWPQHDHSGTLSILGLPVKLWGTPAASQKQCQDTFKDLTDNFERAAESGLLTPAELKTAHRLCVASAAVYMTQGMLYRYAVQPIQTLRESNPFTG